jgi:predicted transcriptional regulator YdeE
MGRKQKAKNIQTKKHANVTRLWVGFTAQKKSHTNEREKQKDVCVYMFEQHNKILSRAFDYYT